jgi:hypothetical protein
MFPVRSSTSSSKPGRRWTWLALLAAVPVLEAACGYQPVHGSGERIARERYAVVLVGAKIADAAATDEVLMGVREGLSREGLLRSGAAYPRVELEVLRMDEQADGLTAQRDPAGAARTPKARMVSLGIVARAWLRRTPGGDIEHDTGDVRGADVLGTPSVDGTADPRRSLFEVRDGARATARRLGQKIALAIAGYTSAPDELEGAMP